LESATVVVTAPSEATVTVVVSPVGELAADDKADPAEDNEAVSVVRGEAAADDEPDDEAADAAAEDEVLFVAAVALARVVERLLNALTLMVLAPCLS